MDVLSKMIPLSRLEEDDPGFMDQVEWILHGCLSEYKPSEIYVTRIRDWFDYRWCYFSGKVLGALGVSNFSDLTLPPFVPKRVISQYHYDCVSPDLELYEQTDAQPLHIQQDSSANFQRFIRRTTNDGTLFWISSGSANSRRGSMMVYHVMPDLKFGWHVTFMKKAKWQIEKVTFISKPVIEALRKSGQNRVGAGFEPAPPTPPGLRVRTGRFQSVMSSGDGPSSGHPDNEC